MTSAKEKATLAEGLFELPLFANLSKKHRAALLEFVEIREFPPGTDFIRQGEYTRDFFVVLSGIVAFYRTEKTGVTQVLEQTGPGEWFGELSAISNQPSLARAKADTACVLAVLDHGLFKELHQFSKDFKSQVDDHYRKRSLAQHLQVVPLLAGLAPGQLRALRPVARFEHHDKDAVIAKEGEHAEDIVLVRAGGLSLTRAHEGSERLSGYLMANSSFGEHAFLGHDERWRGTYTTLMPTDLLVLPIADVRNALADQPDMIERLTKKATLIVAEDSGEITGLYDAEEDRASLDEQLEIMVHSESIKGGEALAIDLEKCIRCNACVEACVSVHDDGVPRLSKKGNRISAEANALGKELSLTTSCYHCETPGCMSSCNYGAIRRDSQGLIRFVWDNCVGCAECTKGCPYDVIRLTAPPDAEAEDSGGWLRNLPLLGGLLNQLSGEPQRPQLTVAERGYYKEQEVKGKAVKCDRCEGLPFEACVYNCPCGAIERVSPSLIFDGQIQEDGTAIAPDRNDADQ